MTARVVIFGAGGHGREALAILEAVEEGAPGSFEVLGFLSEVEADHGREVHGKPVFGGHEWVAARADAADLHAVCAVGEPAARRRIAGRLAAAGLSFATAVHPSVSRTPTTRIGRGVLVFPGASLSCDVVVGDHGHVNVQASLSHDVVLGAFATIGPGARLTGRVEVGEGVEVGAGAVLLPRVHVGPWTRIGAGAVVRQDLPGGVVAAGVPARIIRRQDGE